MELGRSLKYGVLAGLAAGLILGILLFVFQEPLIDRAICYEQTGGPTCAVQDEMVPRVYQKLVLVAGLPIVGLGFGLFFALIYGSFHPYLPGRTTRAKVLVLALLAWIVFPLLPSIRLPPLPPGVANTMGPNERGMWFGLIALGGALGIGLGFALYHLLVRRDASKRGHMKAGIAALAVMAIVAAIPILLFPGTVLSGASLVEPSLILRYQVTTIVADGIMWLVLGYVYSYLRTRAEHPESLGATPSETA